MTRHFRAAVSSFKAGVTVHGVMKVTGDEVTMLPQTFTVKSECEDAVNELNRLENWLGSVREAEESA